MKKIITILAILSCLMASAQTRKYKLTNGNKLVRVDTVSKPKNIDTGYIVVTKEGTHKVYKSAKGKYFINRMSASGKIYKQYITIE